MKFGLGEDVALDGCYFKWDAMAQADDSGKVDKHLVVAWVSVVAEFEMC
jgi:hypothetical protein